MIFFCSCRAFKAPFYIGVVVPFIIMYLFNWVIFLIIVVSLVHRKLSLKLKDVIIKKEKNSKSSFFRQQLIIAVTLSILFGLGWGLGLFVTEDIYTNKTVRDLVASLFVIFTGFHGLFIFITQCVRSKDARNVWKKVVSDVTGRDFSDLSSTFNRVNKKSFGAPSETMTRSRNFKILFKKSLVSNFAEEKSFSVSEQVSSGEELMPAYYKRKNLEKVEEELMIIETGLNSEKNWEDSLKEHNGINTIALHEEHCNETTEKEERKTKLTAEDDGVSQCNTVNDEDTANKREVGEEKLAVKLSSDDKKDTQKEEEETERQEEYKGQDNNKSIP